MSRTMDADNFRRMVAGLCLIAAPLVLLVALVVHPGGGNAELAQTVTEYPGRVQAASLLIVLSSVLFAPALIGLLPLFRGRGTVLGHIGVGLALIGVIGHAVWAGFQIVLAGVAQSGIGQAQFSAMVESGPPNAGFIVVLLMFMVGFFPGLLILAIGLWRGRVAPVWAVACIIALVVWDFVPVEGGAIVAAIGSVLGLIGFGAIGLKLLTTQVRETGHVSASEGAGVTAQPRVQ